ncbi:MAG: 3-hydroxyacyl-ACP dehydratase FabZ [Candidatus Sumerlaeota bacterium]|nr:3-hydroxyacyl-ACP dehydratase FabZ [Candidatus Sumerlaeota bacterium]
MLTWHDILRILPHRYPFLMIDRVLEFEPGKRIVCIKNVTFNEPQFNGHFPENPIMPGVLITEALAQAGAILAIVSSESQGKLAVLTGIEAAKFRRIVRPGDQLRLEVNLERVRRGFGRATAAATVEGDLAAEMTLSFALVDASAIQNGKSG